MANRAVAAAALCAAGAALGSGCGSLVGSDHVTAAATDAGEAGAAPSDAGAMGDPVSCADLLARNPNLPSGRYTIDPDGPGPRPSLLVYCEMSVADGGWTLVARSSVDTPAFGWTSPVGSVSDVSPPYVLDVRDAGIAFGEVMVADRKPYEYEPAAHAYRFSVPTNFIDAFWNAPYETSVTTVLGDCVVDGGPSTLHYVGYTSITDHFFFGDNNGAVRTTGLGPAVFAMAGQDCASGASLNGSQGLVFVR